MSNPTGPEVLCARCDTPTPDEALILFLNFIPLCDTCYNHHPITEEEFTRIFDASPSADLEEEFYQQ
jgi:hypothetical protein